MDSDTRAQSAPITLASFKSRLPSRPVSDFAFAPPQSTTTTTITYSYDPLYRLTAASYSDGRNFQYSYDATGNRLAQTVCAGAGCTPLVTNYVYDNANRLTSVNGVAQTWDNNGNLLSDGASTYSYDAANRLKTVTQGANAYSYVYNGLGDRLSQTVNGVTTQYTLDLNAGLTQVLTDGTNTYLYGPTRIGEKQAGNFVYHLPDALGSVRQLADAGANVTLTRSYEPFGDTLTTTGTGNTTFGFAGEQRDASGTTAN